MHINVDDVGGAWGLSLKSKDVLDAIRQGDGRSIGVLARLDDALSFEGLQLGLHLGHFILHAL